MDIDRKSGEKDVYIPEKPALENIKCEMDKKNHK